MISLPLTLTALLLAASAGAAPTPISPAVPLAVASAPEASGYTPSILPREISNSPTDLSNRNNEQGGPGQARNVVDHGHHEVTISTICGPGSRACPQPGDKPAETFGWWGGYGAPWGK
ncbi:hypothetical protein OC846_003504 [Tilletia horrida]|uniref:Uncharacterized protein n=1 Tax=Tilletia horrida TaxID=155126 RepID=A0AAN6GPB9_9BASI|nr:hypothetical protein OC846_003504 [Tilletia horrida]